MKVRFDESDDLVIDDIPDDVMLALDRRAAAAGTSAEDFVRALLIAHAQQDNLSC